MCGATKKLNLLLLAAMTMSMTFYCFYFGYLLAFSDLHFLATYTYDVILQERDFVKFDSLKSCHLSKRSFVQAEKHSN